MSDILVRAPDGERHREIIEAVGPERGALEIEPEVGVAYRREGGVPLAVLDGADNRLIVRRARQDADGRFIVVLRRRRQSIPSAIHGRHMRKILTGCA